MEDGNHTGLICKMWLAPYKCHCNDDNKDNKLIVSMHDEYLEKQCKTPVCCQIDLALISERLHPFAVQTISLY